MHIYPDVPQIQTSVKEFRVMKFEGEKQPGDGKRPFEIVVGGDDCPTRIVRPGDPDYDALCAKEGV